MIDFRCRHVAALAKLEKSHVKIKVREDIDHWESTEILNIETNLLSQSYNLGTGRGVSVMELIKAFELTNNVQVPYVIEKRRQGDISSMFADSWVQQIDYPLAFGRK